MQEKNNSGVIKEIEYLLKQFFSEAEASNFYQHLSNSFGTNDKVEIVTSKIDQAQLNSKVPIGMNERELITQITTFADQKLQKEKLLQFLLEFAQLMTFNGEISIASELSDDVISKTENDNMLRKYRADAFLSLARISWSQAYWDQSINHVKESYKIFALIEHKEGFARCENMLATIYGEQGEIDKSLNHLEQGLLFLEDSDNMELRAMFEVNLGILYNIKGDSGKAAWNLRNSLEKYEKFNDTRRIARVTHNLGMLYTKIGDYQAALEEFNKSITIPIDNGYLSNCAIGYIGKAFIYTKLKNSSLADVFTDKAMEISYKINDTLSIADIYKIKGIVQNDLENFDLSEEMFENSIRLNEDFSSTLNKDESVEELQKLHEKIK